MNNGRIYSTESGRICPKCDRPVNQCRCGKPSNVPADGVIRIRREVKGRKGKTVTTVSGVPASESGIRDLASELKRYLGTGGSAKDSIIVIQGDHRKKVVGYLEDKGYKVKLAGG